MNSLLHQNSSKWSRHYRKCLVPDLPFSFPKSEVSKMDGKEVQNQTQQNGNKIENVEQTDNAAHVKDVQKEKNKTKGRCCYFYKRTYSLAVL